MHVGEFAGVAPELPVRLRTVAQGHGVPEFWKGMLVCY